MKLEKRVEVLENDVRGLLRLVEQVLEHLPDKTPVSRYHHHPKCGITIGVGCDCHRKGRAPGQP
jgi:hypothetical protein